MTARLGLDVGGANIKAAHSAGPARSIPFELWKRPDDLAMMIGRLAALFPPADAVALTMTAELCDCYATKAEGVAAVLDAASAAFPGLPIRVWGTDGRFHSPASARERPELPAAANWLALATLAARLVPSGPAILIDIGTTTTDLIPILDSQVVALGRTDTERLQAGELVYAGVRRTPLMALGTELPHRGRPTGLAAELFASTLDVYLTLGLIEPDPLDESTADGRPATVAAARDRLGRMIAADRAEFSDDDALALAESADAALIDRLARAADRACGPTIGRPAAAIVGGSGEFLARRLAARLLPPEAPLIDLDLAWNPAASAAACAFAVMTLAAEEQGGAT